MSFVHYISIGHFVIDRLPWHVEFTGRLPDECIERVLASRIQAEIDPNSYIITFPWWTSAFQADAVSLALELALWWDVELVDIRNRNPVTTDQLRRELEEHAASARPRNA